MMKTALEGLADAKKIACLPLFAKCWRNWLQLFGPTCMFQKQRNLPSTLCQLAVAIYLLGFE